MVIKRILIIITALILFLSTIQCEATINIDIIENTPYIDYTIPFNSGFEMNLPDYDNLVYLKFLPNDINYEIEKSKLIVYDNKHGTLILKYKSTSFNDNKSFYDKTFDFDIFQETEINIQCDKNITKINTLEINNTNYSFETNSPVTVHIQIEKEPFSWQNTAIIIICIILIIVIALPIILKQYKRNRKDKLYLDTNQEKIYNIIKKQKGITQQEIANTLDIKKSHMSKILNKMERNDLIERKKVGKVNKIILEEKKKINKA